MSNEYTVRDFVNNALQIICEVGDEDRILSMIRPLAIRAAAGTEWRREDMYYGEPEVGFGSTLLHAEEDNSLFVVVDCWLPGRGVRPHEHGTWAIVVGVTGTEINTYWERVDDGTVEGYAELQKLDQQSIGPKEAITMKTGEIHSVKNATDQMTLSFHVYGRHLNYTGRSQFDVAQNKEIPFIIETR